MKTQDIEYQADDARLVGYLAVDETKAGKRPGIIVAHEGGGLNEQAKQSARRLAEAGYVAFALDAYGEGKPLADRSQVQAQVNAWLADPTGLRGRAHAALEVLAGRPETDASRIAAIGYCLGGFLVLEMAREGEPILAAVAFHPGLGTGRPAAAGTVKAKVHAHVGSADPIALPEQRLAFEKEMADATVDWRLTLYGGVQHSFTNPDAATLGMPGLAYDKSADERSWRAMLDLLDEVF